jgi:hypothetical protein
MTTLLTAGLPFAGFYCSNHDAELDFTAERMFTDESGEPIRGLLDRLTYTCKWREVQVEYAKRFVDQYCEAVGINDASFVEMVSPREYNFSTDRIHVSLPLTEAERMLREVSVDTMDTVAGERHTSRSGFISFYSPNWQTWGALYTWDHNQLQTLIEAYARDMADEVDEMHLMSSAFENGMAEQWIESNTPDIGRLYTVADYLRTREARA